MFSNRSIFRLCVVIVLATAVACEQPAERLTAPSSDGSSVSRGAAPDVAASIIPVTDVEQLYSAVSDPANEGAAIRLAPGTYVLSAKNAAGVDRPNAGRVELQRDMSLYGVTGDRSAVVIDATGLPASSLNLPQPQQPTNRTSPIRIGRGNNTVEWLTVLGNAVAAGGIAAELGGTPSTRIRVAHVVSAGTSRGIDVRSYGAGMAGRRVDAEIVDNELVGPTQPIGNSEGIRVVNFVGADGGIIVANLSGNRTHGFVIGCIAANNRSSNAVVQVRSSGDQFFGNTLGCLVVGGLNNAATGGVANWNSTRFEAHGSQFVDNTAGIGGEDPGGLHVIGGQSSVQTNVASNNTVFVALWGSKVSDNLGGDFEAFGAHQNTLTGLAGTNNHVTIELHGVSKQIDVEAAASSPVEAAATNTVTVIR